MLKISEPNILQSDIELVGSVIESGNLVYGKYGVQFEEKLKHFCDAKFAKVVSSGTSALYIALKALDIGMGDAVIVPGLSFVATANTVVVAGATPVFADISLDTYSVNYDSVKKAIDGTEKKVAAVIVVHEFGFPVDLSEIKKLCTEKGIFLIEDAACALGATIDGNPVGSFGDISCFSFHPRKTLTTGEGGAIICNSENLAAEIDLLRNHGMKRDASGIQYLSSSLNFRLSDIQSALGLNQLDRIPDAIAVRRDLVDVYINKLSGSEKLSLPFVDVGHSWQSFVVTLDERIDREEVISRMREAGFEAGVPAQSMLCLPAFHEYKDDSQPTLVADYVYTNGLALPLCEKYKAEDIAAVADCLLGCL